MKYAFILSIMAFLSSCIVDPVDLDNDVECLATSFVGQWKYQSTDGVVLDSIPDITITITDDASRGDIIIDRRYFDIKTSSGCTAGEVSGLLDEIYELKSINELHRKTTALLFFGASAIYTKE